ncbi:hypothetical protein OG410_28010 [Streptomyces sp. NBC_00659]|nr:hypothetical protein [Streptomyces sp. NBC_00659]
MEALLTRYAKCLDGRQDVVNRRIGDRLREHDDWRIEDRLREHE